jgi:acetyl-CoA decarbonylase/synthase complex subunit beta
MRAAAYLNVDDPGHPYRRRNYPLARVLVPVQKGQVLDAQRGEYAGVNRAIQKLSGGKIKRVFLHSLFGHPHSSCSCFRNLAFAIPGVEGIGVMNRGFAGRTPDGRSWDDLANQAAGKQQTGITGVGPLYLRSPNFLQGEGGWHAVVWMPSELKEVLGDVIPADVPLATEEDVSNLEDLRLFLKHRRPGHSANSARTQRGGRR